MSVATPRRFGFGFWSFVVLMLGLTTLWIGLGIWQINRLAWKEGLIAEVDARLTQPPYDLPPPDQWVGLDLDTYTYHPVRLTGQFLNDQTILVFTSLSDDAKGKFTGPGYWVMVPFKPDAGGIVFVNRGFVPQASGPSFANGGAGPTGEQTITGIALASEDVGSFTPAPDLANHIEWVRNPDRLAAMDTIKDTPVLALTLDLPAGAPGELPQGGETTVDFPNNHFGYALTWFGFALLTPGLLAFWIWRQVRPKRA